ncbi:hypothetical protein I204_08535 [Kwoniella mangroviensis CBS 8886]|nr:hypothetical protein I204_08535 [Kwoniella mangroviensis CBS 8886]
MIAGKSAAPPPQMKAIGPESPEDFRVLRLLDKSVRRGEVEPKTAFSRLKDTMSSSQYFQPALMLPYMAMVFTNSSYTDVIVWIAFNGDWWASPPLPSGDSLLPVPIVEGVQVDWKVLSVYAVTAHNLAHDEQYDVYVEDVLDVEHFVQWEGSFYCGHGQLGRTIRFDLM